MAIQFDEGTDYYALTDDASLTFPDGDWCLGFWYRLADNAGSAYQYLLSNNDFSASNSFNMYVAEAGQGAYTPGVWVIYAVAANGEPMWNDTVSAAYGGDDTWRLMVAQRSGDVFSVRSCVLGGSVVAEESHTNSTPIYSDGLDWNIGRRVGGDADRYWGGIACEFFKGDFTLTDEEVEAIGSGIPVWMLGKPLDVYLPMQTAGHDQIDLAGANDGAENGTPATAEHAPIFWPGPVCVAPQASGGGVTITIAAAGAGYSSAVALPAILGVGTTSAAPAGQAVAVDAETRIGVAAAVLGFAAQAVAIVGAVIIAIAAASVVYTAVAVGAIAGGAVTLARRIASGIAHRVVRILTGQSD